MKSLLVINGKEEVVDIELLDVSYGKFVGYESVIIINTKMVVDEALSNTKPSLKGIANLSAEELPLADSLSPGELDSKRKKEGIEIIERTDIGNNTEIIILKTKEYTYTINCITDMVDELISKEKNFKKFSIISSPIVKFKKIQDKEYFWVEESICIIKENKEHIEGEIV